MRPFLLALLAAALFGAATPLSKSLLANLDPFQLSGLLYLGAALGVTPFLARRRRLALPWRMAPRTQRLLFGAIFFGGLLGPVLLLFGLNLAAAASVSLWLNLEAVATALLGFFFFRDRLGRAGWLGAGGILLSALILTWGGGAAGLAAGLLVAAACLCWGLDNHFTALIDGITPAESTFWKGLLAGATNLALGLLVAPWHATPAQLGFALLTGVFAYGLSITLYIGSAQALGATRSQLVFSTAPYFGLALSVLLLGETISLPQWFAAALVAVSVALLTIEWHSHDHDHPLLDHDHWHDHADEHHADEHHAGEHHAGEHHAGEHDAGKHDPGEKHAPQNAGAPALNPAPHSHRHTHPALYHAHRHWPDLHHRHDHPSQDHPS